MQFLKDMYLGYFFFFARPSANLAHVINLQSTDFLFNLIFQYVATALCRA